MHVFTHTHKYNSDWQRDKHCHIRMGDNCHFPVCVLLSKYNNQLWASEVWCGENVVFVCISKRPGVNVTIWGTAGTVLELSVSQPGCLLRPLFLPLVRYDTDSYFSTAFSPLCIHSMLLIWFLITIYGWCCSVALTWGRRKPQGVRFTIVVMMEVRKGN